MKFAAAGALLWLLLAGTAVIMPDETSLETIRVEDLRSELYFLASDEFRGRALRSPFNELTARYLAQRFDRMGLAPAVDGSYFQEFSLSAAELGHPQRASISRGPDHPAEPLALREDFFPAPYSAQGRAQGQIVFAGFGISAPELGHDDYQRLNAAGKIVLILDDEPGEYDATSRFDGLVLTDYGREFQKLLTAQKRGAAAVLIAPDQGNHPNSSLQRRAARQWPEDATRVRPQLKVLADQIRIPAAYISAEAAQELLAASGHKLEDLQKRTEKLGRAPALALTSSAEIEVNLKREVFEARNVLAYLPGTDPVLRDEVVIIGAHFDHVGADGDDVFNGADDNASGTVGLLEVAEAFAASHQAPGRSVLLAAWNAEESGLLGSYYYVNRPVFPLAKTVAMFQMDMIGRDEEVPEQKGQRFRGLETQTAAQNHNSVNLLGYSRSQDLQAIAETANQAVGLKLNFRYDNHRIGLLRRSDNWPFLAHGVPALFFHTGLHPDYHRPGDTAEKINYEKMARIVKLVFLASWHVANSPQRPHLHPFQPGGVR